MATKFEADCRKVADLADVQVDFIHDADPRGAVEDDGCLNVINGRGLRAMFSLNQDDPKWSNEKTRVILKELKMEKWIGERTLVEEHEDEEEFCRHCGCDCSM